MTGSFLRLALGDVVGKGVAMLADGAALVLAVAAAVVVSLEDTDGNDLTQGSVDGTMDGILEGRALGDSLDASVIGEVVGVPLGATVELDEGLTLSEGDILSSIVGLTLRALVGAMLGVDERNCDSSCVRGPVGDSEGLMEEKSVKNSDTSNDGIILSVVDGRGLVEGFTEGSGAHKSHAVELEQLSTHLPLHCVLQSYALH